jgi:endoglycosylceramidase
MNFNSSKHKLLGFFFIFLVIGCTVDKQKEDVFPAKITVKGDRFIDDQGRFVVLNGINVVNKAKEEQYLFKGGPEYYANLRSWGINCIRFIIIWDGLEPEPGVYNEQYLKEIDKRVQWAEDAGIFVVLDMHQDLYSVKYSDGAPAWATLDEGKPHTTGEIWSDAYLLSEAVQTAFDNFWTNQPAPDGVGVQEHYINLWKHIAGRYADNNTIIGYDIMNEPFPGSSATRAFPTLLQAYGELVYALTGEVMSEEELANSWDNAEKRTAALDFLSTIENYAYVFDALYDLNHEFEHTRLQQFYQEVGYAIREVDTTHILFIEHSYFSNSGVKCSIERPKLVDGSPDPLVAYAPHGYDLVTDTKDVASAKSERMDFIFKRIKDKGIELNMPIWLGEWGAYYNSEGILPVARYAISLIENNAFGHAYWSYHPGLEDLEYFQKALLRPYPAYINGELLNYEYRHGSSELTIVWKENKENSSKTVIFPGYRA